MDPQFITVIIIAVTDFVIPVMFLIFEFFLALIMWKVIKNSFLDSG